jgi:hypothetical protein
MQAAALDRQIATERERIKREQSRGAFVADRARLEAAILERDLSAILPRLIEASGSAFAADLGAVVWRIPALVPDLAREGDGVSMSKVSQLTECGGSLAAKAIDQAIIAMLSSLLASKKRLVFGGDVVGTGEPCPSREAYVEDARRLVALVPVRIAPMLATRAFDLAFEMPPGPAEGLEALAATAGVATWAVQVGLGREALRSGARVSDVLSTFEAGNMRQAAALLAGLLAEDEHGLADALEAFTALGTQEALECALFLEGDA